MPQKRTSPFKQIDRHSTKTEILKAFLTFPLYSPKNLSTLNQCHANLTPNDNDLSTLQNKSRFNKISWKYISPEFKPDI